MMVWFALCRKLRRLRHHRDPGLGLSDGLSWRRQSWELSSVSGGGSGLAILLQRIFIAKIKALFSLDPEVLSAFRIHESILKGDVLQL
jgi:hypothetical protein